MKEYKSIGLQIKEARQKSKLTQQELADLTGLNNNRAVYNYEAGFNSPSIKLLKKMSKILKCKFVIQSDPEGV